MVIELKRKYFPDGTNAVLLIEDKFICNTIELPWKNNKKQISCIPEGKYIIKSRYSAKFKWHFEIEKVPNRSLILFHPANDALSELNGCIAPVTNFTGPGKGSGSQKAFKLLKQILDYALDNNEEVNIIINS